MKTINILLAGVGGQGVILASKLLSEAAMLSGLDIKQSEVHGMSQRGGSVISHVRIGDKVHSPIVPECECDILVGFEPLEALRNAHNVREGGVIIYSTDKINPSTVSAGFATYPEDFDDQLDKFKCRKVAVNANGLADKAGNKRAANVVMVGVMSNELIFPEEIWQKALRASVPQKVLEANLKAFSAGRGLV